MFPENFSEINLGTTVHHLLLLVCYQSNIFYITLEKYKDIDLQKL